MTTKEQLRRVSRSLPPKERAMLKFRYEHEDSQPPQDLLTGMSKPEQIEYHSALFMLGRIHFICDLTLMGIEAQLREARLLRLVKLTTQTLARVCEQCRDSLHITPKERDTPEYDQLVAACNYLLEEAQKDEDSTSSKLEFCWRRRAGLEGFIARIRAKEFDGRDILAPSILDRLKRATEVTLELGREQGLEMESIEPNEDYAEDIWYEFVKVP